MAGSELERATEQLVLELKGTAVSGHLASGLAHHFNNLLGGMLGLVTLAPNLAEQELCDLCARLREQIEDASTLTATLLSITRGQGGGGGVCDLAARTRELVRLADACAGAQISVTTNLPDRETWAAVPPRDYTRVLLDLVVTEVEAIREHGEGAAIEVRLVAEPEACVVTVESTAAPLKADPHLATWARAAEPTASRLIAVAAARALTMRVGGSVDTVATDDGRSRLVIRLPAVS